MTRWFLLLWVAWVSGLTTGPVSGAALADLDIDAAPHLYRQRPPRDRFTRFKTELEAGRVALERGNEKAFLISLLQVLEVPVSSQMLVFSTTSLHLSLISPRQPRALYFSEDLYVGYVAGGRIEIVSLDPELGGIFYIFDIPKDERPPRVERSERCMNCHVGDDTGRVPGLVVKSVIPGPGGGSLTGYRLEQTGHGIPLNQRFGGWYVTGWPGFTNHQGNVTGRLSAEGLRTFPVEPGKSFDWARYPVATSDALAQLLHEHQAGFVNRVVAASYRARSLLHASGDGGPGQPAVAELEEQARVITGYMLFAEEVPLPAGGVAGDAAFRAAFARNRRATAGGVSLKDFDLRTRLFQFRCSYMIYSAVFEGLPTELKQRVYEHLRRALAVEKPEAAYAYLPAAEKQAIRGILKATLKDLPEGW